MDSCKEFLVIAPLFVLAPFVGRACGFLSPDELAYQMKVAAGLVVLLAVCTASEVRHNRRKL